MANGDYTGPTVRAYAADELDTAMANSRRQALEEVEALVERRGRQAGDHGWTGYISGQLLEDIKKLPRGGQTTTTHAHGGIVRSVDAPGETSEGRQGGLGPDSRDGPARKRPPRIGVYAFTTLGKFQFDDGGGGHIGVYKDDRPLGDFTYEDLRILADAIRLMVGDDS